MATTKMKDLVDLNEPEKYFKSMAPFAELMMYNKCAIREVETKLNVLNDEFSQQHHRNPFETIKSRIKSPMSIMEKLRRKGVEISVYNMEHYLNDIAGIRVICSFPEDIYTVSKLLGEQDDIRVLEIRDYIKNPKPNGYRSLHQIIEIPIFLSTGKKYMRVEVQYRTIAMDFWASLDHKMKYKKHIENADYITAELRKCAEIINETDFRMQTIRQMIDAQNQAEDEPDSNE